ncbi:MAG: restriction endonuclease subunit S [Bacteroidales bacterium]|nr:restriction endonuclease subunit S [Bacteroidales bacterium]MCD8394910.1 restriction endonuclease subunit S [Bacteroidales bacterium]
MEEWKKYKLGDVLTIKYGKDHKTLGNGDIPVYGSGGVMRYADRQLYDGPSILIPRKGSLNNIMYTDKPFWTVDTMFWTIVKTEIANPKYLYYSICKYDFASMNVGTAIPSLTVPVIEEISVTLPSIDVQKHIVDILSSLDAKIELNRRINDNLEAQAQALFRSWFVDFEPWGGVMPEDWTIQCLSDIAVYQNGLAMQKFPSEQEDDRLPVLKIKELGQGFCDSNSDTCSEQLIGQKFIVNDGDVVFSWSGTLMVKIWVGGKCGLNQHLFKVTSDTFPKWLYFLWTQYHNDSFIRIAKDKAVTMGHIKRGELEKAKVFVPSRDAMSQANDVFAPLINASINLRQENRQLISLRDTLLPRLMSGELKISQTDR